MSKAIITGNKSRHNLKIGETVEVISRHKGYFKCKGSGMAHYCVPLNECKLVD